MRARNSRDEGFLLRYLAWLTLIVRRSETLVGLDSKYSLVILSMTRDFWTLISIYNGHIIQ